MAGRATEPWLQMKGVLRVCSRGSAFCSGCESRAESGARCGSAGNDLLPGTEACGADREAVPTRPSEGEVVDAAPRRLSHSWPRLWGSERPSLGGDASPWEEGGK